MRNLHRDDTDAVLARQLKDERKPLMPVSLERVRTRARFVSSHARADLIVLLQGAHHRADILQSVNCAQSGEDIERVLAEAYALIVEVRGAVVAFVPSDDAILL